MRTRLALIGIGKSARDRHIPVIAGGPDFERAATASRNAGIEGAGTFPDRARLVPARPDIACPSLHTAADALRRCPPGTPSRSACETGKTARRTAVRGGGPDLSADRAPGHVVGSCICNDVSERAYRLERSGQWTKGKRCPTFGPREPWLVIPAEVDPDSLGMTLKVDDELIQNGSSRMMILNVPFPVSHMSRFMRPIPGEVIATATPAGAEMGCDPSRYPKLGDRMQAASEGLAAQRQNVVGS